MPKEELQRTLQELQLELDKVHFDVEDHRDQISESIVLLEGKLREERFMSGDEYLIHEIKEALQHFEETHPRITDLVGRMSDLLSKMGI